MPVMQATLDFPSVQHSIMVLICQTESPTEIMLHKLS